MAVQREPRARRGEAPLEPPQYLSIASLRGVAGTFPHPLSWQEIDEIVANERAEELRHKLERPA